VLIERKASHRVPLAPQPTIPEDAGSEEEDYDEDEDKDDDKVANMGQGSSKSLNKDAMGVFGDI
jgi:hypothetical protein